MSERRVLYIVEGDSAEKKLIRLLHRFCNPEEVRGMGDHDR